MVRLGDNGLDGEDGLDPRARRCCRSRIFGIPAGTVIAKLGAKKTMLISDAARGPLMLVVPILHSTGHLSFAALLGTTFAIGIFAAPYFASSRLIVPEVAGEDEQAVASVNAVLSGVTS